MKKKYGCCGRGKPLVPTGGVGAKEGWKFVKAVTVVDPPLQEITLG